jgi:hypothetical protein
LVEINVIELVENSKDPYIVFNEKKKSGFTREELETHFQTLSDMIKSDETVAKSRKKAAIKSEGNGIISINYAVNYRIGKNAR